jgi:hypothetical protein
MTIEALDLKLARVKLVTEGNRLLRLVPGLSTGGPENVRTKGDTERS